MCCAYACVRLDSRPCHVQLRSAPSEGPKPPFWAPYAGPPPRPLPRPPTQASLSGPGSLLPDPQPCSAPPFEPPSQAPSPGPSSLPFSLPPIPRAGQLHKACQPPFQPLQPSLIRAPRPVTAAVLTAATYFWPPCHPWRLLSVTPRC